MFLKNFAIPFSVFVTGACVLIIEIVAIRILAPYFGNTIFTVSGVITVVLLALSLGYYVGGKLADKYPKENFFYGIITASGALVIFLHLVSLLFLVDFGYQLPLVEGPLITSLLFFFIQNFFMGMLSPFAIKLQKMRLENLGIGSTSGQIFFWSTLGSIVGSLSAGFFLIPHIGIDKIIIGIGFLLMVLGLAGTLKTNRWLRLFLAALLIPGVFVISSIHFPTNVIFAKDSLYQKIIIFDGIHNGQPARFLQQDRNSSSAIYLNSDELAYEYTKYYALYQLFNPHPKDILVIGGGAYSVPKVLLKDLPDASVDVVEIEPMLYDLAKQYFNLQENPRLHNFVEDGRRFLHDSNKQYDVIFSDAYSSFFSTPEHLTTQEFFTLAAGKLSSNGVFIANVASSLKNKPASFAFSEINTLKSVFTNSYFFAVKSPELKTSQNLIFVGHNSNAKIDFNSPVVKNHENYIISGLETKLIDLDKINLSGHSILTDNFAPVDYLISREFTNLY